MKITNAGVLPVKLLQGGDVFTSLETPNHYYMKLDECEQYYNAVNLQDYTLIHLDDALKVQFVESCLHVGTGGKI